MADGSSLPRVIRGTFAGRLIAAAMNVDNPRLRLIGRHNALVGDRHPTIARVGEGVLGELLEILGIHQVLQGLRGLLLVERVLVDQRPHGVEIVAQRSLFGVENGRGIIWDGKRKQDDDDADHHHQLDQSKAALSPAPGHGRALRSYHVLYLVPSKAVPSDLVYTSNTLCPPQESESGSSCIERKPHSSLPVMGSTGMCRRKRIFLPLESTPFTRVSRSGGYPWLSSLVWNAPRSAASL